MPKHKVALLLIKSSDRPIAAPSANYFGKPSPTTAMHVKHDLYGKIDLILDAGPTHIGVESTVIDLTGKLPVLLRAGGVTFEQLKEVLNNIKIHPAVKGKISEKSVAKSPGMKYRHYAPNASLILVEGPFSKTRTTIRKLITQYKAQEYKIGILATHKYSYKYAIVKYAGKTHKEIARNLFKILRKFDKLGVDVIIAEGVDESDVGLAVMNRLRKAASKIIKL